MAKLLFVGLLLTAASAAQGGCGSGLEGSAPQADTAPHDAEGDTDVVDTDTASEDVDPDLADLPDVTDTTDLEDVPDSDAPDAQGDADIPEGDAVDGDDDGDAAPDTADAVDPCEGLPDESPCDDLNACTIDERCLGGRCAPRAAASCDDDNPCTDDTCRPDVGCVSFANLALCDDGDPCTTRDRCAAGLCRPGVFACDDGNACTRDTCASDGTCSHTADDTLSCDDGSACTAGDRCEGGLCRPGPDDGCASTSACTTARCGDDGKTCLFTNLDGLSCDDGDACTAGDQCQGGVCRSGLAIRCGWDSECALFRCDRRDGCLLETPLAAGRTCSDDDRCTTGDRCDGAGFCVPEAPAACDDGNPCTEDSCDATWGCSYVSTNGPCDDESLCTTNDACQFGQCRGTAITCNDQNACTADSCDPLVGCQFLPVVCDDGNPCTADACSPGLGCTHTPVSGTCDDGIACTSGDTCVGGQCLGLPGCDDEDPCTIDVCDRVEGCVPVERSPCPVGLVEITAVGVDASSTPATPGFGQWFALSSEATEPIAVSNWLLIGDSCDCEATLTSFTLLPGQTAYGLRASLPRPTPSQLAPGGPTTLADFGFEFGAVGDGTAFASGDVLELIDETGAVVSTFVVD